MTGAQGERRDGRARVQPAAGGHIIYVSSHGLQLHPGEGCHAGASSGACYQVSHSLPMNLYSDWFHVKQY